MTKFDALFNGVAALRHVQKRCLYAHLLYKLYSYFTLITFYFNS